MSVGEATGLIVATTGLVGLILAHRLGLLGQKKDAQQQAAATKLQKRITAFDELESLNDRLEKENERLRVLIDEADARGDVRLARQGERCRTTLAHLTAAIATLQSLVTAEIVAEVHAGEVIDQARRHIELDHPEQDPDL